jgi:hypothetical protein
MIFAKTRQCPATLVLLLRGIAKGEPRARLARALGVSRKQLYTLQRRIQANLNETAPTGVMTGTACEADELYQNAWEKTHAPSRPPLIRCGGAPTSGRGTAPTPMIGPPIISIISRETGEPRWWVCDHADTRTCATLIAENIPAESTWVYTDEWQRYRGSHPAHATVRYGVHE